MDVVDVKMVGVSLPAASSICHSSEERPHLPSVCFHLSQFPRSSSSFKRSQSILQQIVQNSQKWCLQRSSTLIFHATISSATATFLTLDHFRSHHISSLTFREWATVHNQFNLVIDIMVKKYDDAYFWNHRLMWLHPAVRLWSFDEAEWTHRFELI